jgi:FAD/FMN-containing dehydrogenase
MKDDWIRQSLEQEFGKDNVLLAPADLAPYCRDWHRDSTGTALAVLRPRSTRDVASAVALAARLGLSLIPQGGNTGLVLGGLPQSPTHHVVLSLERLNKVRSLDPDNFSMVVEAGCILSVVKDKAAEQGMFFPLSLGAQESCQIGGNVSTNAGGINVLRYGMMRELVLGLEVVLPDGQIWNGLSTLRKDNRGIDLKQLFLGAEGTLGIVTAAALKLSPFPTQKATALLALRSLADAVALFRLARRECCDLMSAFEFMAPEGFVLAKEAMPELTMPIAGDYPAYVLMEISGSGMVDIAALMQQFIESIFESDQVLDGVIASSESQARTLWRFREVMIEGQVRRGRHLRTDVSVPLSHLADFVSDAEAALASALPDCLAISYGHIGDGNVHLNVLPPRDDSFDQRFAKIKQAKQTIDEVVLRYKGSISAEHGIGREKREAFEAQLTPAQGHLLRAIKKAIDPGAIMNPGCLFPEKVQNIS